MGSDDRGDRSNRDPRNGVAGTFRDWHLSRRLDHPRLMAAGMVLFLLLAPCFGVQYTVYPALLMLTVSLAWEASP
jgi:hypothetical protein